MTAVPQIEKKDTRSGFGQGLLLAGRANDSVVALCADLKGSLKMDAFATEFPDRYIECGIAEANMIGVAAGLALDGHVPFAGTFAAFATGRVYDQIRQSVAYSNANVKICASHAGITLGEDGATHQILEDIGMMRMLPNMTVLVPADYNQTVAATLAAAAHRGPVYLRFGRPSVPNFTNPNEPLQIGKAQKLRKGADITLIATGHMVWHALQAAELLSREGIQAEVLNIHTIKPLDAEAILESVKCTKAVVTAEEHMANGGLGDAVALLLAENLPCPQEYVAIRDQFGQSGTPAQLMEHYGLTTQAVAESAKRAMARR